MARPRRSGGTRLRLLEAGVARLRRRGYHGTGLKEVLDEVGVPKGSFYNYFESKEDFGVQVIRHYAQGTNAQLDAVLEDSGADAMGGLRRFFRDVLRVQEAGGFCGGCLVGNLGAEMEDSESCREALRQALDGWRDRFAAILARAQEQGTVRGDVPARELGDLTLFGLEGALLRMKVERSARPLRLFRRRWIGEYLRP